MCHSSARPCSARVSSFLFLPLSCFLLPLLFSFVLALSREGLAFRLFIFSFFSFFLGVILLWKLMCLPDTVRNNRGSDCPVPLGRDASF